MALKSKSSMKSSGFENVSKPIKTENSNDTNPEAFPPTHSSHNYLTNLDISSSIDTEVLGEIKSVPHKAKVESEKPKFLLQSISKTEDDDA